MMAESTSSDTVTLFEKEHCELMYRIPALIHIQDPPTYLAFAEMRHSLDDTDALYLVMRRGVEIDGSIQWEPIKHLRKAKQCGYRSMNPCPVYDSTTRTLFLFFVCVRSDCSERYQILLGRNAAKLCYVTSTDEGKTWSLLTKVTNEVLGDDLKKCATLAVGPGHGIQTSSGRLILPAYLYYMHACVCKLPIPWKTKPHSFIFYSDDHGRSWHKGSMIWKERTGECEVAEMICGNSKSLLYCSARTEKHYRVEAVSSNPGMDFANPHYCNDLCEPPHGCQGSVVSFIPPMEIQEVDNNDANAESRKSDLEKGTVSWLIYSHPTSRKERVDLGIYLNKAPLEPSGWKKPWIINKGPSGYSDLVVCKDSETFGCLFECGIHSCEKINFRRFTLGELLENLPKH
ncbi:sialidase-3 [Bombina bombina]|uniref:sialidase-3 n=1 Tax=Bombina bombina TaxID=8345 RepID=UPI00235B2580|nr:sialidase-3 [Bombina bombina]XP_053564724.1 sialidase-3 [Bombina bombina]